MTAMEQMGKRAKEAAAVLAVAGRKKNDALLAIAQALLSHSEEILKENQKDLENGKNAGQMCIRDRSRPSWRIRRSAPSIKAASPG